MTIDIAPTRRPTFRIALAAVLAAFIALLGWVALAVELDCSVSSSLSRGNSWGEAFFLYLRYFTILTNIGIATLMSVSAGRLARGRPLPPVRIFNAGLIYILVTGITYESLLRGHWQPRGLRFLTDLATHDLVPALTFVFWLAFAPRAGARWHDALWMLSYPVAYFLMTVVAGAFGQGYPYDFLDVDKLGYFRVLIIGMIFVAVFFALGLGTTGVSRVRARTWR